MKFDLFIEGDTRAVTHTMRALHKSLYIKVHSKIINNSEKVPTIAFVQIDCYSEEFLKEILKKFTGITVIVFSYESIAAYLENPLVISLKPYNGSLSFEDLYYKVICNQSINEGLYDCEEVTVYEERMREEGYLI